MVAFVRCADRLGGCDLRSNYVSAFSAFTPALCLLWTWTVISSGFIHGRRSLLLYLTLPILRRSKYLDVASGAIGERFPATAITGSDGS